MSMARVQGLGFRASGEPDADTSTLETASVLSSSCLVTTVPAGEGDRQEPRAIVWPVPLLGVPSEGSGTSKSVHFPTGSKEGRSVVHSWRGPQGNS